MRTATRLLALVLGLVLAAGAVFVAVEAVLLYRGQDALLVPRTQWNRSLGSLQWGDGGLRTVAIVLVAVGAVLVLMQLVPRRVLRLPVRSAADRPTWISKRSVRRLLVDTAEADGDVIEASAKLGRRRGVVAATTARSINDDELRRRLADAEQGSLETIELVRQVRTTVRIGTAKDRVR